MFLLRECYHCFSKYLSDVAKCSSHTRARNHLMVYHLYVIGDNTSDALCIVDPRASEEDGGRTPTRNIVQLDRTERGHYCGYICVKRRFYPRCFTIPMTCVRERENIYERYIEPRG